MTKQTDNDVPRTSLDDRSLDSARLLDRVFASLRSAVFVVDGTTGCILLGNRGAGRMFGCDLESLVGQSFRVLHADAASADRVRDEVLRDPAAADGIPWRVVDMRRADGTVFPAELTVTPLEDDDGAVSRYVGVVRDQSDKVRGEQALRASEQRFRVLVETMPDLLTIHDEVGAFLYASPAAHRIFGCAPEQLLGRHAFDLLHPEDQARAEARFGHLALHGSGGKPIEMRVRHADGSWRWVETIGSNHVTESGIDGFVLATRSIAERKEVEEALRLSEERFRMVLSHAPVFVSHQDLELRYTWSYNPPPLLFGGQDLIGRTDADFLGREEADALAAHKRQVLSQGQGLRRDVAATTADGTTHYFDLAVEPLRGPAGDVTGLACVMTDVTDRHRMEQAIRQGRERYRVLFDANPFPMWVVDLELLSFLAINDAAIDKYGYSRTEFLELALGDICGEVPPLVDRLAGAGDARAVRTLNARHRLKSGASISVDVLVDTIVFGGRRAWLMAISDLSERAAMEEQFRQSQKMEAIGRLAGGVAHDFNNLLTVISGYCELALDDVAADGRHRQALDEVSKAASRAADLTRQLLTFSRKKPLDLQALCPNDVIEKVGGMLRRLVGENVSVDMSLAPSAGHVLADRGLLEQVLVNLAVNARDAMPEGGTLSIATSSVPPQPADQGSRPQVLLTVSDTGTGMSSETVERVFEPFFTTKDSEKGTGLGLSTVYGIVKQFGGSVDVASVPGAGTTFRILLPGTDAVSTAAPLSNGPQAVARPGESVLVVEDDERLRKMTAQVLERSGYSVLSAATAEEATRIAERQAFDVLLTDVVLPGAGGRQLIEWLGSTCPNVVRLCMSGHLGEQVDECRSVCAGFIEKPFSPETLRRTIREALDARGR